MIFRINDIPYFWFFFVLFLLLFLMIFGFWMLFFAFFLNFMYGIAVYCGLEILSFLSHLRNQDPFPYDNSLSI